ncbi:MAG: transporter [Methylorubrum populi]
MALFSLFGKLRRTLALATMLTLPPSTAALAVDLNATDYVPLPVGTNVFVSYTTFATRDGFKDKNGFAIKTDTHLDSLVEIARVIRYMDIAGFTVAPQILVPGGSLFNGSLGGAGLRSAGGLGDPILAAPVWLINSEKSGTYFAITPYVFVPLGSYTPGATLDLGENRWRANVQAGLAQALGPDFLTQLSGEVLFYGDNKDAAATPGSVLTQKNTFQFQGWLSYVPPSDKTWRIAAGYSQLWGGTQFLNGIPTGTATRAQQIRFEVGKFLAPDFQILGQVQRDLTVRGGFKEDLRAMLRLVKVM